MNELQQSADAAMTGLNGFDWIVLAIVIISMLVGMARGLGREILSLAGWVAAFVGANLLAKPLANSLTAMTDNVTLRYLVGWTLVFVAILAIFSVLGGLVGKQLRQPGFNVGNRALGGGFGILRGLVIAMVVTLGLKGMLPRSEQGWLDDAELMPTLEAMADWFSENFDDLLDAQPVEAVGDKLDSTDML